MDNARMTKPEGQRPKPKEAPEARPEISRWREPPETSPEEHPPRRGDGRRRRAIPPPFQGATGVLPNRWLAPPANLQTALRAWSMGGRPKHESQRAKPEALRRRISSVSDFALGPSFGLWPSFFGFLTGHLPWLRASVPASPVAPSTPRSRRRGVSTPSEALLRAPRTSGSNPGSRRGRRRRLRGW